MDPLTTPLLVLVLGNLAKDLITDACKDHLKDKLKSIFGWLETLGEKDKVEPAYIDAMEQAFGACLEMLLQNIKAQGYSDEELKQYQDSIKSFIKDKEVADELLKSVREPSRNDLPSPEVLRVRWQAVGGQELPPDTLWNAVASAFRRQIIKRAILSDELRELLNAGNLQQLKELIERQGGVKVQVRRDKYSLRMRSKFSPVDLANLMPAYADDPGRMVIQDVFVAQNVRENPPPVEIPKDIAERLRKGERHETCDSTNEDFDEQLLEKFRTSYISQVPKPVLDVIAAPANRLLVLTGEPGSGKSTLMRYLLTGIIEPPVNRLSGLPLPWSLAFKDAFPLLIELRDFYALRQRGDCCETFLEYVAYMGKTDQWFLDDHAVHEYLENSPSLVMFDGLDEIFDAADRERIMNEIAGFAQRYPKARIIVTSRPVGYKEQVLREAGFIRHGIQDLDDEQIDMFIRGWFSLTFPQQLQQANQRIERVLASVQQSKPIRLLAGNPMLLTIMALLAREEELPRERAKFYEKAVEVLCHHWDANRNLELSEDRYLNADDKKNLLRRIAMRMQSGNGGLKGNFIAEDDLEQAIQAYLIDEQWQPDVATAKKAARRMIQQLRERNYILCLRGPHLYGFVHRTFLEYLTAAEYVRRFDRQPQQMTIDELIKLFDQHCRKDEWREVLRLICGQIDEQFVGRIVKYLAKRTNLQKWGGETAIPELPLAIWCLSEMRNTKKTVYVGELLLNTLIQFFAKCRGEIPKENSHIYRSEKINDFLGDEMLPAVEAFGDGWHGAKDLENRAVDLVDNLGGGGLHYWAQFVSATTKSRLAVSNLTKCNRFLVRKGAVSTLVASWPDEETRKCVEHIAINDPNGYPRYSAFVALSNAWPDERTRKFIAHRSIADNVFWVRRVALEILLEKWPDENTRKLLTERAVQDKNEETRTAVLDALVKKWPDETTRKLLIKQAAQYKDEKLH